MAGTTNRGCARYLQAFNNTTAWPATFSYRLYTSAVAPGPDTNVVADLTEIAPGNGYTTGGRTVNRDGTDMPVTEDDTNDRAQIDITDQSWTASGGPLPSSGAGARYAGLDAGTDMIHHWDLGSDRSVSDTQTLTIQDSLIRASTT